MWIREELTMEAAGAALAPTSRRRAPASVALGWVRERLSTTPGRLVLTSILIVVGAACFGVIATAAEQSRERAVGAARTGTEPLLVQAVNLYTALSDANATVATGLLSGGLEPTLKRARYLRDLSAATTALTALTREAGTSTSLPTALGTVADQLPVYSGLVESARANNRQGFPIGAAYLRQAATLLTDTILPAADRLYTTESERLNDDYRTGTATAPLIALGAAIAGALALLLIAQRYLARMSRRIFNSPMLVATVALAAVSVWGVVGLVSEQNALATAQREGSDSVEVLSAANVLLSRAQGDLSLTLVNRGSDEAHPLDFAAVTRVLGPGHGAGGLIAKVSGLGGRTAAGAATQADFMTYRAIADRITRLEGNGLITAAIGLAPTAGTIADHLSADLTTQIGAAQDRFARSARDAASALDGLWLAIPLITVLAAALALLGLRQRINEYR